MSPQYGLWGPLYARNSTPGKVQQWQRNTFPFFVSHVDHFIQGTTLKMGWEIKFTAAGTPTPQTGMASSNCLWDKDKKGGGREGRGQAGVCGLESLKCVAYSTWADRENPHWEPSGTFSVDEARTPRELALLLHSVITVFRRKTESTLKPRYLVNGK